MAKRSNAEHQEKTNIGSDGKTLAAQTAPLPAVAGASEPASLLNPAGSDIAGHLLAANIPTNAVSAGVSSFNDADKSAME